MIFAILLVAVGFIAGISFRWLRVKLKDCGKDSKSKELDKLIDKPIEILEWEPKDENKKLEKEVLDKL